jgi:amino acid adenylation domain-containing protein
VKVDRAAGAATRELSRKQRRLFELLRGEGPQGPAPAPALDPGGAIPRRGPDEPAVPSFGQRRLWFIEQLQPGSPAYHVPGAVHMRGALDLPALGRSLRGVTAHQESLRTSFRDDGGEPALEIAAPAGARPPTPGVVDLRRLPPARREAETAQAVDAWVRAPFDLARAPLARTGLVRLADHEHVFLLVLHHGICDIWSVGVFFRNVTALYAGRPLPELPIRYSDYALWQERVLRGEGLERLLGYWRERLDGAPHTIDLPYDRPRPAFQSMTGGRRYLGVDRALTDGLKEVGTGEGASLYMVLLAALFALLHRYSGQETLLVGVPVANRNRVELEGLIGLLFNTLVLRAEVEAGTTFRDLLGQVRERLLAALAHQDLPFERLVEALRVERDTSRNPLYQVLFAFQNVPPSAMDAGGVEMERYEVRETASREDLELDLREVPEGLAGWFGYDAALFDPSTVERTARHLPVLLSGIADRPDRALGDLPLLPRAEAHQLLVEWNDTAAPPAPDLLERFAGWTLAAPDAVAATDRRGAVTYGELRRRASAAARRLAALGAGPEAVVAVLAERGTGLLAAFLALLEAEAVYLPLEPAHPAARQVQVLERARPALVLASGALLGEARAAAAALPEVLALEDLLGEGGVVEPQPPVPPHWEAAAYAIFTSGSTGTPKGAVVRRAGMANHLLAKVEELGLGPGDTVAQNASQCFDISVWQLLAPLAAGGRVAVVEDQAAHDPARLLERVERERVTVLEVVPSVLGFFLDEALGSSADGRPRLPALRRLVPTGEALPPELARRWLAAFPAVPLLNAYGPTECSDDVTHFPVARPPAEGAARVPIGRGLRELRLLVLDRRLGPAPVGVAGELWVAGVGVGRGYLGEPRRTAEVFVPEPDFERGPGARAYRTGDRARRLADGTLDFLGRLDRQVKVRGFRIELGEIEAALGEHPAVRQAAVLPREAGAAGTVLVAYVAAAGEMDESLDAALRQHLGSRLPEPMVPAAFVALDALPLTATGKVDRRALAALDAPAVRRAPEHVPPRTPVEESLAGIWAEVLKVERVGALDDFFEAGGQSLLATQVVSRIRQAFRVELPVRVLFQKPTLEALAQEVEVALLAGHGLPEAPPLVPVPRDRPLEPSFGQERFWFIDRWRPGLTAYNIFGAVRLRGDLRTPLLARAFAGVLRRHEVLRTTFDEAGGAPVQVIGPPRSLPVPVVDLRRLPAAARHRTAVALGSGSAGLPFDLRAGPLLRALLVRLDERDHLLAVTAHHIVYDVWSRELLIRELGALYEAFWHGRPSPLPALPVQYADFAGWQRSWLRGEVLERQVGYWRERLAGLEAGSEPPADRPRPPVQSFRGARELASLSPELTAALGRLGRERGATLFMVLLAGFYALLHRSGAGDDLAVGSPIANRTRAETEGLIGFFVNTLVLRTGAGGDLTFAELLARTRETALGAYSHQDLAFEQLVAELEPPRDPSRQPFFQVLFNLLTNYRPVAMELPGLRLAPEANHSGAVQFDLILSIYEDGGALHFSADYTTDLFDRTTTARLLARYATVLAAAAADPARRVGELPVESPAERHQVTREWNDTAAPVPAGAGVHEWIAAHARRAPDAPAVSHGERGLTYGELDAAARALAARLRRLGVGPEVLVGVHLERSPEVLVALLAVLHAGGAYLPLDPDYPEERLRFMVADSGARLVLTQRSLAGRHTGEGVREVMLDEEAEDGGMGDAPQVAAAGPDSDALCYVIYTSGSTGRPKGVMVSHRNLAASIAARLARYPDPPKGFLLLSSFAFDSSVAGIFGTLAAGGRLVLPPGSRRAEGVRLGELADREGVSHLLCVPSLYSVLLDEGGGEGLEAVIVAGEACHPDLVARHFATRPWTALWNEYGPTEGTVWATVGALTPDAGGAPVPIGRPVGNARVHLLDPDGRPVPAGVPGELCLGGAGVARGYLGRPGRTAAAFVPDPFGSPSDGAGGARLYRTGDLARWLPGGELLFLGRLDGQVKVRGLRVEPGEVEAALREHRAVREAAVVAVAEAGAGPTAAGGAPRHDRLAAYLELREGEPEPQAHALRRFLRERLPDAMVPGAFVVVDALPRTPSGKVDRGALARAGGVALAPEVPYVAPRTETEERVVGIWRELLGRERVGVNDHFFDLGGHSLLTTRLLSRLRDAFGVEVPLPAFFEEPTVAALAEGIELARWAGEVAAGRTGAAPARAGEGDYEEGEL